MPSKLPKISTAIKLPKKFWSKIVPQKIHNLVWKDADRGLFQNGAKGLRYISRQYVDLKSRYFQGKTIKRKVQPYYGRSIRSNQVGYVNMELTGDLKMVFPRKVDSDNYGVWMGVNGSPKDGIAKTIGKVTGNARYGRELRGLNDKNKKIIREMIVSQFDKGIRKGLKQKININVSI